MILYWKLSFGAVPHYKTFYLQATSSSQCPIPSTWSNWSVWVLHFSHLNRQGRKEVSPHCFGTGNISAYDKMIFYMSNPPPKNLMSPFKHFDTYFSGHFFVTFPNGRLFVRNRWGGCSRMPSGRRVTFKCIQFKTNSTLPKSPICNLWKLVHSLAIGNARLWKSPCLRNHQNF